MGRPLRQYHRAVVADNRTMVVYNHTFERAWLVTTSVPRHTVGQACN
jgi:hypothetical protein